MLEAPNDDPFAREVDVTDAQQRDLTHPKTVLVDQREEQLIARLVNGRQESPNLILREVAREP